MPAVYVHFSLSGHNNKWMAGCSFLTTSYLLENWVADLKQSANRNECRRHNRFLEVCQDYAECRFRDVHVGQKHLLRVSVCIPNVRLQKFYRQTTLESSTTNAVRGCTYLQKPVDQVVVSNRRLNNCCPIFFSLNKLILYLRLEQQQQRQV